MTTALVTGATGFLGNHLVRQLIARGVRVRALVRKPMAASDLVVAGAEVLRGDLLDPASLKSAFDQTVDWVFHAAADTRMWRGHQAEQWAVNVEGTLNLLSAARGRCGRFLHTSTVAVYGLSDHLIREDSPKPGAQSWVGYVRSKSVAEQRVLDTIERGLDAVVLNPTHMLGPGDRHNWSRLFQRIEARDLPGAPPGIGCFVDVRDVARAHVRAAEVGRCGQNYLLGGVHASFVELIATASGVLGVRGPEQPMADWMLRLYARWKDFRSVLRGVEPVLTPEAVALTCQRMQVDSSRAERELDLRTESLLPMVHDTIQWMRGNGMLRGTA